MPKICKQCGRPKETYEIDVESGRKIRKRARDHECETAQVVKVSTRDDDRPYIKNVHLSQVEPGGDLYEQTRGKNPEWEIVFRSHSKLEKLAEKTKRKPVKRRKREGRKLKAPAGKKLEASK